MQLALIGCGKRASDGLLAALAECSNLRVTALVDPDPVAVRRALAELRLLGVPAKESASLLAADDRLVYSSIDAVVVASPHAFHEEQVRRWLCKGKPVFVEKPLACSYGRAVELARISRGTGLTVSDPRRFRADLIFLGREVGRGGIGRLRKVRYEDYVTKSDNFHNSWRNDPWLAGGGVLLDLGCHTLSALLRICAVKTADLEHAQVCYGRSRVETKADLQLHLGSGVEAQVVIGLVENSARGWEDVTLWGDTGKIRLRRRRSSKALSWIEVFSWKDKRTVLKSPGRTYDSESLRRFLRCPGRQDIGTLRHHLEALRIISEAYERTGFIPSAFPRRAVEPC